MAQEKIKFQEKETSTENQNPPINEFPEAKIEANPDLEKFIEDMPDVVEEAVSAGLAKEKEFEKAEQSSSGRFTDNKGRTFDPTIHEIDIATGQPKYTPTGRFKRRVNTPNKKDENQLKLPSQDDTMRLAQIKQQATMWADAFIHIGISLAGEEWKPDNIDGKMTERDLLISANERYMSEKGIVNLPSWTELALAYGMYTVKRFNRPKTQGKLSQMFGDIKLFFSRRFSTKKKQAVQTKETELKEAETDKK